MARGTLNPESAAVLTTIDPYWSDPHGRLYAAGLAALKTFAAREQHCNVPHNHVEGQVLLGAWVSNRRTNYRTGKLHHDKLIELEQQPGWTWDPAADEFSAGLDSLIAYAEITGHTLVPGLHKQGTFSLGAWVSKRRLEHKAGKLSLERTAALAAQLNWSWDPSSDGYRASVTLLDCYVVREGTALVPGRHIEAGFGLGSWVVKRRQDYRKGRVTAAEATELEQLPGWSWDPSADEFNLALAMLDQFIKREGHARVTRVHIEDGFPLGKWVANRRNARTHKNASPEQTTAIESRPHWTWDPLTLDFDNGLAALDAYITEYGEARVPQRYISGGLALGKWVTARRTDYKQGRLTADRTEQLEMREGWTWAPVTDDFDNGLAIIDGLIKESGHPVFPRTVTVDGRVVAIGKWVDNRRSEYRSGRMSADRVRELESRSSWTWAAAA
jgi:hypothetical protein